MSSQEGGATLPQSLPEINPVAKVETSLAPYDFVKGQMDQIGSNTGTASPEDVVKKVGQVIAGIAAFIFHVLFRIFVFILWTLLFLLIFIPIALILIILGLFIYFLCVLWGYGKQFIDLVIKIINPLIPVPVAMWNGLARTINKIVRFFGGRSVMQEGGNPNSYKIRRGAPTMPQLFMWILYPLRMMVEGSVSGYLNEEKWADW